jgi:FkbM family methyltransferase
VDRQSARSSTASDEHGKLLTISLCPGLEWIAPNEQEACWQYDEIFFQGCYDQIRIPPDGLVVDVGANTGLFTFFVKTRMPSASVVAIEPMPDAVRALTMNIRRHDLGSVTVHQCALGSRRERDVRFTYYPAIPGNSTRYPEDKELQKEVLKRSVPAEDVDAEHRGYPVLAPVERTSLFLAGHRTIDVLKVDVEGAELDVLHGIDDAHWPLLDQIVLEVQDLRGRLRAVCDMLARHGLEAQVRPSPLIPVDIRTFVVYATR